jgi:hypothetical protein
MATQSMDVAEAVADRFPAEHPTLGTSFLRGCVRRRYPAGVLICTALLVGRTVVADPPPARSALPQAHGTLADRLSFGSEDLFGQSQRSDSGSRSVLSGMGWRGDVAEASTVLAVGWDISGVGAQVPAPVVTVSGEAPRGVLTDSFPETGLPVARLRRMQPLIGPGLADDWEDGSDESPPEQVEAVAVPLPERPKLTPMPPQDLFARLDYRGVGVVDVRTAMQDEMRTKEAGYEMFNIHLFDDAIAYRAEVSQLRSWVDDDQVKHFWGVVDYTWHAPLLYHGPLYFEQVSLERYGQGPAPLLQPACSAASFFGTIPLLPYHVGAYPPSERIYTLGHRRAGDRVPYQHHWPRFSWRGVRYQSMATTGLIFALP